MVDKRQLKIIHLYPSEMNIYGDSGNVLVLNKRLSWRGIGVEVVGVGLGDKVPADGDILISGGGQDAGQLSVQEDLLSKGEDLRSCVGDGMVMLVVCGTYQLFGKRFITRTGREIEGIGILDMETRAGQDRMIGNIVIDSFLGRLVGYENHSGRTYLSGGMKPLGTVVSGQGNNDEDDTEGAVFKNVIGTYLHGPILPKNPALADELIKRALVRKYGQAELAEIDDSLASKAAELAAARPR